MRPLALPFFGAIVHTRIDEITVSALLEMLPKIHRKTGTWLGTGQQRSSESNAVISRSEAEVVQLANQSRKRARTQFFKVEF